MKSESRVSIVQLHASLPVAVAVLQKRGIADSNSNKQTELKVEGIFEPAQ